MKVLIHETTKEQRKRIISDALALGSLDCPSPSDRVQELFQKYIDGEMELVEIQNIVIHKM